MAENVIPAEANVSEHAVVEPGQVVAIAVVLAPGAEHGERAREERRRSAITGGSAWMRQALAKTGLATQLWVSG